MLPRFCYDDHDAYAKDVYACMIEADRELCLAREAVYGATCRDDFDAALDAFVAAEKRYQSLADEWEYRC